MNLYLLKNKVGDNGFEVNLDFVIAAPSPKRARAIAAEHVIDEPTKTWLEARFSSCRLIAVESKIRREGVVCRDTTA